MSQSCDTPHSHALYMNHEAPVQYPLPCLSLFVYVFEYIYNYNIHLYFIFDMHVSVYIYICRYTILYINTTV